jgi:hypothetical protein
MKRAHHLSLGRFRLAVAALLITFAVAPVSAQQPGAGSLSQEDLEYLNRGLVDDWSSRHVVFSNPGTLEDARRNGKEQQWWNIVSDPRYRMQWVRRYAAHTLEQQDRAVNEFRKMDGKMDGEVDPDSYNGAGKRHSLHRDWSVTIGASGASVPADVYPAKYTFAPLLPPSCTNDYVVYPVANSTSSGANLVGLNNLYTGTCTGTVPSVLFAYNVGTGSVQTSPVLSLDGTKVAFIESINTGSYFHVLVIDKSGNAGCPSSTPCNGTAYNAAVAACTVNTVTSSGTTTTHPCTFNAAVDTRILINANGSGGPMITRSSPFVDYKGDIAYLGDDNGNLHKFNPVFKGTPAEIVTSGSWPACSGNFFISCGSAPMISSPVYDSGGSGRVLFGGNNGSFYAPLASAGGSVSFVTQRVSMGTTILDAPIVDVTRELAFVASTNSSNLVLVQIRAPFNSNAAAPITAKMGATGTDAYDGAFDNAYLSSTNGTGYMYFCGNISGSATPALLRVAITSGTMSSANDGNVFQLVSSGNTGTSYDCTPLTEYYNTTQAIDYLFVGVKNNGAPSGCGGSTCVMNFSLPTASPFTFPSSVIAATSVSSGSTAASNGMSGFVIDGSGTGGASQIYFGNYFAGTAVQMSQAALK